MISLLAPSTLSYFQAIVIGLLQGVTGLFPVSSLGHSVLVPEGGTLISFDYAFGADDMVLIIEFPDNVAAAALGLAVSAAGAASTRITPLLSPEEIDQAAKKTVAYTPPR